MRDYFDGGDLDWFAVGVGALVLFCVMIVASLILDGRIAVVAGIFAGIFVYGNLARGAERQARTSRRRHPQRRQLRRQPRRGQGPDTDDDVV